jgi:hypothetical protein
VYRLLSWFLCVIGWLIDLHRMRSRSIDIDIGRVGLSGLLTRQLCQSYYIDVVLSMWGGFSSEREWTIIMCSLLIGNGSGRDGSAHLPIMRAWHEYTRRGEWIDSMYCMFSWSIAGFIWLIELWCLLTWSIRLSWRSIAM